MGSSAGDDLEPHHDAGTLTSTRLSSTSSADELSTADPSNRYGHTHTRAGMITPDTPLPARIAAPARRALDSVGITNLAQLTELTEKQICLMHGIGPRSIGVLRDALTANGLSFVPDDA